MLQILEQTGWLSNISLKASNSTASVVILKHKRSASQCMHTKCDFYKKNKTKQKKPFEYKVNRGIKHSNTGKLGMPPMSLEHVTECIPMLEIVSKLIAKSLPGPSTLKHSVSRMQ